MMITLLTGIRIKAYRLIFSHKSHIEHLVYFKTMKKIRTYPEFCQVTLNKPVNIIIIPHHY